MNSQFYNQFNPDNKNIVTIFGDRLKKSLLNLLSAEAIKMEYHVLVLSDKPMSYPLAGKVLVCDDLSIVHQLIDKEKPAQIYLASKVQNDLLYPFTKKDINQLTGNLAERILLYYDVDSTSKINLKTSSFISKSQMICSINYNLLKDNLPQISKIKELKSKSIDEQISEKVYSIIKKICPYFLEVDQMENKICFIDQIKGLYDENVIRSIARNLKSKMNCTMLIGNTNTYQVKAI
ncbi:MAG: hypothetical protein P8Y99_10910 [Calditrichaceae bacterium]